MAHKKGGSKTKNGRDSAGQRLGVKLFGGEFAHAGQILIRQRGTKWEPGENVSRGRDDTLYAKADGFVKFTKKELLKYTGRLKKKTIINVEPEKK